MDTIQNRSKRRQRGGGARAAARPTAASEEPNTAPKERRQRGGGARAAARPTAASEEPNTATEEVVIAEEKSTEDVNQEATDPSEESQEESRNFKYPLTLSRSFPARIIFTAVKTEGVDISEKLMKAFNYVMGMKENTFGAAEDGMTEEGTIGNTVIRLQNGESLTDILFKAEEGKAQQASYFQTYENKGGGERVGSVTLPLQRDLRYSDLARYETANLGLAGGALEGAMQGQNPFAGATSDGGRLAKTASALAASAIAKGAGEVLGGAIGSSFGVPGAVVGASALGDTMGGLSPAVRSATRIASAPNQRTLFQQVGIRSFAFTFKMVANSHEEALEVRNIVKFFRQELYPEKIPLGDSGVPLAYKFPNMFEIDIKNNYGENPAFKIQRCYLRDVQTSFNATGTGMHWDGNFVEVDISLAFEEIVTLDKEKIRGGF